MKRSARKPAGSGRRSTTQASGAPSRGTRRPKRGRPPRRSPRRPQGDDSADEGEADAAPTERIHKIMAAAGIGSRRACEELIQAGRVEIDRKVVTELGLKVDPFAVEVRVDGVPLPRAKRLYFLVNKPPGVVSTNRDPAGRARVVDLVPPGLGHVYTVGRLDRSSEGLILVTNDGALAARLTHPRYEVPKIYQALVAGVPTPESIAKLQQGIHLAEGIARVDRLRVIKQRKQSSLLELVLREGRNREIRRILARVGHKVLRLRRVGLGPLKLADLPPGGYRRLARSEVSALWQASEEEHKRPRDLPPQQAEQAAGKKKRPALSAQAEPGGAASPATDSALVTKPLEAPAGADGPSAAAPGRETAQPKGAKSARERRPAKKPRQLRGRRALLVSGGKVLDWNSSRSADWTMPAGASSETETSRSPKPVTGSAGKPAPGKPKSAKRPGPRHFGRQKKRR